MGGGAAFVIRERNDDAGDHAHPATNAVRKRPGFGYPTTALMG